MNNQANYKLTQAYEFIKKGDFSSTNRLLEDALEIELENEEVLFALKCRNYWGDVVEKASFLSMPFERGEHLIAHWKYFLKNVIENSDQVFEQTMYSIRKGIFTLALENYKQLLGDRHPLHKAEAFRKVGICYKQLGDYETALRCLGEANALMEAIANQSDSAAILAEMADCYALCGNDDNAKVLFREAFFICANRIDLIFLESELILSLIELVRQKGYTEDEMLEWIPIYGVLYGVLNIKRQLRPQEVGRLKQAIFTLENELKDPSGNPDILIPRLINHYFWLIDHYVIVNDDRSKINETLLKIKLLDNDVHSKYTA